MSDKKRICIISQDMNPYTNESSIAPITRQLPQYLQENGKEIRVFMPRFGVINERRHRLHEVVRLSGINVIIDEDDYPLLIKVASLPKARIQVYFLDNDDFFKRKQIFADAKKHFFDDNTERMVFYCKGVLETIKKMGWAPDVIHCHGWMTALIPLYLKTAYKNDPIFANTQVVYSVYKNGFDGVIGESFTIKAPIKRVETNELDPYGKGTCTDLSLGAITYADAVIYGEEELPEELVKTLEAEETKPVLDYHGEENYLNAYSQLYNALLEEKATQEAEA